METVKIFLASSAELEYDRKAFEAFLYQKSKLWKDQRDIFLELNNWEDFIDAMSKTRLQDEYNKAIRQSDIFVMLFWTKVGKYTEEEFETARTQFERTRKPLIYTYFKDASSNEPRQQTLEDFRNKLSNLQHFETPYRNTEGLLLHFSGQLDKLYNLAKHPSPKATENLNKQEIYDLVNKGYLFEAFEKLNEIFKHSNDSLNALEAEFINHPNHFNMATFTVRLKVFTAKNIV